MAVLEGAGTADVWDYFGFSEVTHFSLVRGSIREARGIYPSGTALTSSTGCQSDN